MIRQFHHAIRQSHVRRLTAVATLLAYLAGAIGYPMPEAIARSAGACGQQVCGCVSAEKCQSGGCGCSRGVAPVIEESSCCVKKQVCCSKKEGKTPSCCAKKPAEETKQAKKPKPTRWVIGVAAQKCRGGGITEWQNGEVAPPGAVPTTWAPSWPSCGTVPFVQSYPFAVAIELLDPPPRPVVL